MPNISIAHRRRMKNAFDPEVARYLAAAATEGRKVSYGELSEKFGRTPRGWGDPLGGIAIRCHEAGLPLLSVIVVNAASGLPSVDAVLYADLGLSKDDEAAEQQRCFAFDWTKTELRPRQT
ncbi:MAG TPA: hypothetical protein VNX29_07155 [Kaistia sp.]|nr:hypothetical protein [Kaistia sp.]